MCSGVKYTTEAGEQTVRFINEEALMPVHLTPNEITYLPWGRRENESGGLPHGGWARLDSIRDRLWQKFQPRPVQIPVSSYMGMDARRTEHWFDLEDHQLLQGLVASIEEEQRVYVVTVPSPEGFAKINEFWPRILERM